MKTKTLLLIVVALFAGETWARDVVVARIDDTIQPASQRFIERVINEADTLNAGLIVLELDTPGGLVDSTREITTAITMSRIPVVVFVAPSGARAASAGFFILLSADVAVMAPGTNTGAAHPVGAQGDIEGDMRAKVENDVAAMVRSLAENRGRNVEKSIEAVRESSSFTADEALENELIDHIVNNVDALLEVLEDQEVQRFDGSVETLDFDASVIVKIEASPAEKFLSILANPNIAYLLMALGMLGIYVEITHPGGIFPGAVGSIAILLALYSVSVLPINVAGVALICVAMVLFLLEVKVTSYGMLTIGGLISFVLGSLMLFDSPIPDMRVSLAAILPTAFLVAGTMVFLLSRVLKIHRQQPMTGREGLIGEIGRTLNDLAPDGKVLVHGEYWDAHSRIGEIAAGSDVRVLAIRGRQLTVEATGEYES